MNRQKNSIKRKKEKCLITQRGCRRLLVSFNSLLKTYTHSSLSPTAKQTSRKKHALKLWCHWPAMMSLLPVGSAVSCAIGWLRQTVGEHCWGISSIHPKAEKKRVRVFVGVTTPHWGTAIRAVSIIQSQTLPAGMLPNGSFLSHAHTMKFHYNAHDQICM